VNCLLMMMWPSAALPQAKIVFTAPTRPLVRQQFQAVSETVGFPKVRHTSLLASLLLLGFRVLSPKP
jgi:ERCC4-related helicase